MDVEKINLKQLNEDEVNEQYQVTIKNKFAALENLDDNGYIKRAGETIRENIRISSKESIALCESKSYKSWFDEECLKLVDRRKQAKLQWLQDPNVVNENNLRNVRREVIRHFRNKEREYLKGKITDIELNCKNKNIRDLYRTITEFKKGYQPKTNLVKDERGDLLADPQKNLNRWKKLGLSR
jgi:Holliday junction resolvase-like predicted endonuclease